MTPAKHAAQAKWQASHAEERRVYMKAWRAANPEKRAASKVAWNIANQERNATTTAAWRVANVEHIRAYDAHRRAAEPERIAAWGAAWREANAERKRATSAAWYAANANRARAVHAVWVAAHPERGNFLRQQRRARQVGAPGSHSPTDLKARWAMWGGKCWMCGVVATATDHFKPLSKGGSNWAANLRPVCKPCNSRKHAHWPFIP